MIFSTGIIFRKRKANLKSVADAAKLNWPITNISVKIKQVRMGSILSANVAGMRNRRRMRLGKCL
jgi:hypothetical protein